MAVPTQAWPGPSLDLHHNQNFTLQKYLLLQEQHESLRQHLERLRTPARPATVSPMGSPKSACPGSSDSTPYGSRSSSVSRHHSRSRRSSAHGPSRGGLAFVGVCLEPVLDEATLQELALEQAKLCDVNEGIKRALTELLNCEAARNDRAFRSWVQARLMDTEKELRVGRRKRGAPGYEF